MFGKTNIAGGGLKAKGSINGRTRTLTTTTKISKTGKGVFLGFVGAANVNGDIYVDGVKKTSIYNSMYCRIPFNSSFEIRTTDTTAFRAFFSMGSHDLTKGMPSIDKYNYDATGSNPNLVQSVTGKGFLFGVELLVTGSGKIVIDGTTILDGGHYLDLNHIDLRFNNSLQLYSSGTPLSGNDTMFYSLE